MTDRHDICGRMDAALLKMRAQRLEVRAIYLTREDWDDFHAAMSAEWGSEVRAFAYRDHHIRLGERSRIYSTHGVEVAVPMKLSRRVAA